MIIAAYRIDFSMIMRRHTRSMSAIYSGISDGCCPLRSLWLAPSAPQGAHVNNPLPMRKARYNIYEIGGTPLYHIYYISQKRYQSYII